MASQENKNASPLPELNKPFEGKLNKFTNVVKGWQIRHFILDPHAGRLEYFLPEETSKENHENHEKIKRRGAQHLAGAQVIPSDEDANTFTINFASGDTYKLRATGVKDRQVWVDRIRAVAQMHADNASSRSTSLSTGGASTRSKLIMDGEPGTALQNLDLSTSDAFHSVYDIMNQIGTKNADLKKSIESLNISSEDKKSQEDLLILKAVSAAASSSLKEALAILQEYEKLQRQ